MAPIIKLIDQLALLDFKAKIREDPFGIVSSWNDSLHFCQWQGVICDQPHQTQRVTTLDLWSLKLVGSVSPHIGNLSFLQKLILQDNSFYNKILPAIGRLADYKSYDWEITWLVAKFLAIYQVVPTSLCFWLIITFLLGVLISQKHNEKKHIWSLKGLFHYLLIH